MNIPEPFRTGGHNSGLWQPTPRTSATSEGMQPWREQVEKASRSPLKAEALRLSFDQMPIRSAVYDIVAMTALRANRLLTSLDNQELNALLHQSHRFSLMSGEILAQQAAPIDRVIFIVEGRAKAEITAAHNPAYKLVVNFLKAGDDIGLLALVGGTTFSSTCTVLEDTMALSTPLPVLQEFLSAHDGWYRMLAEMAMERLRTTEVWLGSLI